MVFLFLHSSQYFLQGTHNSLLSHFPKTKNKKCSWEIQVFRGFFTQNQYYILIYKTVLNWLVKLLNLKFRKYLTSQLDILELKFGTAGGFALKISQSLNIKIKHKITYNNFRRTLPVVEIIHDHCSWPSFIGICSWRYRKQTI